MSSEVLEQEAVQEWTYRKQTHSVPVDENAVSGLLDDLMGGNLDLAGFEERYGELPPHQQDQLIIELLEAHGNSPDNPDVQDVLTFHKAKILHLYQREAFPNWPDR